MEVVAGSVIVVSFSTVEALVSVILVVSSVAAESVGDGVIPAAVESIGEIVIMEVTTDN